MNRAAVMVAGTDTGVGKTFVAERLVRALVRRGVDVGVMKPFETGIAVRPARGDVAAHGSDAAKLLAAAGRPDDDIETVSPYRFREALAPGIAARRAGVSIDIGRVQSAFHLLSRRHAHVVVEGAGGLYSPLGPRGLNTAQLAKRLGLAMILVVANRLGSLSHVLLALEVLARRRVPVRAVVLTEPTAAPRLVRETNAVHLPFAIRADAHIGDKLIQALEW